MTPLAPLQAWRQWIIVKLVPLGNGKTDKLPIDPRTGQVTEKGSDGAHNPDVWLDHATAASAAAALQAANAGPHTIGFVITERDPFWCLDIDGAATPNGWSGLSQQLVASLPNTVVEVSQSGRGLHVWGQGVVPPHRKKRVDLGVELYTERRFIAIGTNATGDMTQPCPTIAAFAAHYFPPRLSGEMELPDDGPRADWKGPADDADLLRRALASRSAASVFGAKASFADLWDANVEVLAQAYAPDKSSSEPYDRSSADAALAQHLAFWTGCDKRRMADLMRQSKLVREKWEREDYFLGTIAHACEMQRDVLQDKPSAVETAPPPVPAVGSTPASPTTAAMTPIQGSTFLNADQQAKLFEGCVYIIDLHRALVPGGKLLKPDNFRAAYGGYTFAMDSRNERTTRNAWEAFTESQVLRAPRADGVCFKPAFPYGHIVSDAGRTRANKWWPVKVPRVQGDPTPFLQHLAKLLPDQRDQTIIVSYMAACVQHVGVKFQWAPLIQGVEGNGKTFLSRCVAEAIGRRYVHWPKASKIAKQFNGWLVDNVFYAVEDIHTSENVDVIEELKPMITGGDGIEIEKKGIDQESAEIVGNFIFNSNHRNGLRKTKNDRRFAMFFTAQQQEEHLARDGMTGGYMKRLYDWAKQEDGYAIVAEFLHTFKIPDEFNPATGCQRAPKTSSTDEAIEASMGRVEQEVMEAVDQGLAGFAGGWVSSIMLDKLLERQGLSRAVPLNRRREMLQSLGYDWHPALERGRTHNPVLPDGGKPRLFIRKGHPSVLLKTPAEAARAYSEAQGVAATGVRA